MLRQTTPPNKSDALLYGREAAFVPLLFGSDINVYSLARAFHESYGLRSTVWGKYATGPCYNSDIINFHTCAQNDRPDRFMEHVQSFARSQGDKIVFLIGCGDNYIRLCSDFLGSYPDNVIAPYPGRELVDLLFHKERFYRLCEERGLAYPKTFVYRPGESAGAAPPFEGPYILKPANPILYWQHPFPGQKKAYRFARIGELERALEKVYAAGYDDSMIVQDFIPGDDTYMRVMTGYANQKGRVELMALGHVLLEEHTPQGIGNHAVIINEYDEALAMELKNFLEVIGFTGFFNFDLKYDQRDGKMKVLELNVRQGRSNYYVTGAGHNLAEYLVNDYILNQPAAFTIAREKYLWSVVPRSVMFSYIRPQIYREEMRALIMEGRINNPLNYAADRNFKRRLSLFKSQLGHIYKYRKYLGNSVRAAQAPAASAYPWTPGEK